MLHAHTAWWLRWSADPAIVLAIGLLAALSLRGLQAIWRRAGPGRGVRMWRALALAGGLAALALALLSPIDALAEELFWAHMVQHLALILVAAPLLALARPAVVLLWALPPGVRRRLGRAWRRAGWLRATGAWLVSLPVAWCLSVAALWLWHAPALYQAALANDGVHIAEHASFLGSALIFWWAALNPRAGRAGYGASVLAVVTMGVQSGVLGALFTFSSVAWYPEYAGRSRAWGLAPLEDQQLAGLVMWIPASVVYLGAAALLFVQWLAALEQLARRREQWRLAPPLGPSGEKG